MQRFITLCLTSFLAAIAVLCQAQDQVRIESFSPLGITKGVRQVTARFSEPMTTFGDPRNESPFDINCPEKGSGRWADVKNWVFDFDHDLPAGVTCSFKLREGLKALAGTAVVGERLFSFSTGGPAIVGSRPADGKTVNEDQIFILVLDGEADETSVLANVHFSVEGMVEPLGIQIVKGTERTAVLKAAGRTDNSRTLTIRCRQSFPSKAAIKLIWGAGITSISGVTSGEEQILNFSVRDQFTISFRCDRTNANAPCIPMLPMRLSFSSPVPANLAKKIVMKSGKRLYKPDLAGDDEEGEESVNAEGDVHGVKFIGPFPEKKSFVIELPGVDGRCGETSRQPGQVPPPGQHRRFPPPLPSSPPPSASLN